MSTPERRKAQRREILDSFSLFVVVPSKGYHRLPIRDLSDLGIGFDLDLEGEDPSSFPATVGTRLDLQVFLNQTLHLPLSIEMKRVIPQGQTRRVGAEFTDRSSAGYQALMAFLQMLDKITDAARISAKQA